VVSAVKFGASELILSDMCLSLFLTSDPQSASLEHGKAARGVPAPSRGIVLSDAALLV
jgi:hypothetical protein